MCVICKKRYHQKDLIRFYFERSWKKSGKNRQKRGIYICQDSGCHKENKLKRFFGNHAEDIINQLV